MENKDPRFIALLRGINVGGKNALFTLATITHQEVLAALPPPKESIETLTEGLNVVFWSVSREHQTKTTYMKLSRAPVYQEITVRNHNTVFKLLELFEEL